MSNIRLAPFCLIAACLTLLSACDGPPEEPEADITPFPPVERPVSAIISNQYSDEEAREGTGEAETVLSVLGVEPGETVADIGAGRGFYMQRLAEAVGPEGLVYAQDIFGDVVEDLSVRASANGFANVEAVLGTPFDPKLPKESLDHALLVHMYHEIENPYALLWHLRESLKPGATIAIVDDDRITSQHGTPPELLECEVSALGFVQVAQAPLKDGSAYVAIFRAKNPRPAPQDIRPCQNPR
ncbi:methyltransferase domain-containing protein [Pacificimonas sp. WHA3]|uniref:Methyltransferase domain-containing protein n=1 Tax=Pacificimonas pallii TaxID=2827236 RepID=A0ABS6SGT3_9SPHN|nr:methyltransferase domain-containing protein [Pacificimonas pallii]MBV7257619.1 methyltransferase domain-containing protein [Pacificimonas pallii]